MANTRVDLIGILTESRVKRETEREFKERERERETFQRVVVTHTPRTCVGPFGDEEREREGEGAGVAIQAGRPVSCRYASEEPLVTAFTQF